MEWVHIRTTRQCKLSFCIVSQAAFNCLQAKMQLPWIPLHSVFQPDRGRMLSEQEIPLASLQAKAVCFLLSLYNPPLRMTSCKPVQKWNSRL